VTHARTARALKAVRRDGLTAHRKPLPAPQPSVERGCRAISIVVAWRGGPFPGRSSVQGIKESVGGSTRAKPLAEGLVWESSSKVVGCADQLDDPRGLGELETINLNRLTRHAWHLPFLPTSTPDALPHHRAKYGRSGLATAARTYALSAIALETDAIVAAHRGGEAVRHDPPSARC